MTLTIRQGSDLIDVNTEVIQYSEGTNSLAASISGIRCHQIALVAWHMQDVVQCTPRRQRHLPSIGYRRITYSALINATNGATAWLAR